MEGKLISTAARGKAPHRGRWARLKVFLRAPPRDDRSQRDPICPLDFMQYILLYLLSTHLVDAQRHAGRGAGSRRANNAGRANGKHLGCVRGDLKKGMRTGVYDLQFAWTRAEAAR